MAGTWAATCLSQLPMYTHIGCIDFRVMHVGSTTLQISNQRSASIEQFYDYDLQLRA